MMMALLTQPASCTGVGRHSEGRLLNSYVRHQVYQGFEVQISRI